MHFSMKCLESSFFQEFFKVVYFFIIYLVTSFENAADPISLFLLFPYDETRVLPPVQSLNEHCTGSHLGMQGVMCARNWTTSLVGNLKASKLVTKICKWRTQKIFRERLHLERSKTKVLKMPPLGRLAGSWRWGNLKNLKIWKKCIKFEKIWKKILKNGIFFDFLT